MAKRNFFSLFKRQPKKTLEQKINHILDQRNMFIRGESSGTGVPIKDTRVTSISNILNTLKSTILTAFSGGNRGVFRVPEWDFSKVQLAFTNESIFRRSVEKYVEQIRKQEWGFVGNNPVTVKYIKKRFEQMATVQSTPTSDLLDEIAFNMVLYSNCIIVKRRKKKSSGGKNRVTFDGKNRIPVAGFNVVDPTTIEVDRDNFGNVRKWKQTVTQSALSSLYSSPLTSSKNPEWPAYSVIHIKDRSASPSQYFFSMPMSIPVIADMQALRELEELTLLESVKVAVPKLHAKVGSKDQPGTQEQVDDVASTIRNITGDGILVTTERVTLDDVAQATTANNILTASVDYFRSRVMSGLGMSGVAMGDSSSANRATAQVVSAEMQSTSAKFQRIIKKAIEFHIIRELLYESGYNEFSLDDENMVYLLVPEIDLSEKIRREAHYLNLYLSNALTENELRKELGRDILSDIEREQLYMNRVQIPVAAAEAESKAALNTNENNARPSNQHGKALVKPKVTKDEYLSTWDQCLDASSKEALLEVVDGSKLGPYDITTVRVLLLKYLKTNDLEEATNLVFSSLESRIVME